jgi:DNA-binding NarL/FixJ family response regulator
MLPGGSFRSVLGSAPSLTFGDSMISRPSRDTGIESLPPLPLEADHWQAMVEAMGLSPREAQVAELKICGAQLKQMATLLGMEVTTVRAFQNRICVKAGIRRHEFFAHILRVSHEVRPCTCRQE